MMGYNLAFHAYRAILNRSFYAYSAIVDSFVVVFFKLRSITFCSISTDQQAEFACLSQFFGQGYCYFGCDKAVYLQLYPYTTFFDTRSCGYLDSLGKFGLRAKSGFKNKCRVRACYFGLEPGSGFKMWPVYNSGSKQIAGCNFMHDQWNRPVN